MTRRAISPRFAISTRWNIVVNYQGSGDRRHESVMGSDSCLLSPDPWSRRFHPEQDLIELDELAVLDAHLGNGSVDLGRDVVENLHRLHLTDHRVRRDARADLDVVFLVR